MVNNKTYSMKIMATGKTLILALLTIFFLYGCKKDNKPVVTSYDNYKGDINKTIFTPDAGYSPAQSFLDRTISFKTYSNKISEITLPADVSITYSGKFEVNSNGIHSAKKSGRKYLYVSITLFNNDQVQVRYTSRDEQTNEEINYIFFGKKI